MVIHWKLDFVFFSSEQKQHEQQTTINPDERPSCAVPEIFLFYLIHHFEPFHYEKKCRTMLVSPQHSAINHRHRHGWVEIVRPSD